MSIYESTITLIYSITVAFIFGACMGSFLNCTAIRLGKDEPFVKGRSHCVSCGHDLYAKDLVPIVSWLLLKGKCRYCGASVSKRYPLVELIFATVTVLCLLKFDITLLCFRNLAFLSVLFLLTLTDIDTMTIPDRCHVIAIIIWIVTAPFLFGRTEILLHIVAALVFGGGILVLSLILDRILGKDTLGGGDIKLLFVIGIYFGFAGTLLILILSCVLGLIFNRCSEKEFPFGPWIALSAFITMFAGNPLIDWYIGLI